MAKKHVLPDVLEKDLRIVFVGPAAGKESAKKKAYYANPKNRFYLTLKGIGLTPNQIAPENYKQLRNYKIGLTDLCKVASGNNNEPLGRSKTVFQS